METKFLLLSWFFVAVVRAELPELQWDKASVRVRKSNLASLECCYSSKKNTNHLKVVWIKSVMISRNKTASHHVNMTDERVTSGKIDRLNYIECNYLELLNVTQNDTGLYQCLITGEGKVLTPGTFLQVYAPIRKTLNISEHVKNSIITAEGILLLLCVLIPGTTLLCKTKGLNNLINTKAKEEENIYEGLNLDECNSTYNQLQHCQIQGPYQDVMSTMGDDTQLEKP